MEKNIESLFDSLDQQETELVMNEIQDIPLDKKRQKRIYKLLLRRHNKDSNGNRKIIKRSLALAAILIILAATSLSVFGNSNLPYHFSNAIDKLYYSFVPNHGFVQTDESEISFILEEVLSVENDDAVLTLSSAYIKDNTLTSTLTLRYKNMSHEDYVAKMKAEAEYVEKTLSRPFILYVNETGHDSSNAWKNYEDFTGHSTSGIEEEMFYSFELHDSLIQADTAYRIYHKEQDLNLSFKLAPLSEALIPNKNISTDSQNDIFIMADADISETSLDLRLYPINHSIYSIDSFTKYPSSGSPNGEDLYLETESGIKTYTSPGGNLGPNTKFSFSINETDQNFKLHIPFIMVKSQEHQNIRIPLPKKGETIALNMSLDYLDCTVTILEAERRLREGIDANEEELRLVLSYDNKTDNKILCHTSVDRLTRKGKIKDGAYSYLPDEQGVTQEIYLFLEKWDWGSLYLQFHSPSYFITDEYSFNFTRPQEAQEH